MKAPRSSTLLTLALGAGAGAALMYCLDPQKGRARRAWLADQGRHYHKLGLRGGKRLSRDGWHRARGWAARLRQIWRVEWVADRTLEARVRTRLGRLVAHPHSIRVLARGGRVMLFGSVNHRELERCLAGVARTRGVREVGNALVPCSGNECLPRRGVNVYRVVHLRAPVDRVFRFWDRAEGLPEVFSHLEEVRRLGPGWLRWKLRGNGTNALELDTMITRRLANQLLAWKTPANAKLAYSGMIHLEPHPRGGTRLHLRLTFCPPEHTALEPAELLGPHPLASFAADCRRMKEYLESGVPPQITAERPALGG